MKLFNRNKNKEEEMELDYEIEFDDEPVEENIIKFAKVRPDAIIPSKKYEDAGYDIYANFEGDMFIIPPLTTAMVPTGIASALHPSKYLQVAERGSTGTKGIKYSAGVVDASYRGEIQIVLYNANTVPVLISKLSRSELIDYTNKDENGTYIMLDDEKEYIDFDGCIIYPYSKAIAQLIVHEVHDMTVEEISYEELKEIPSERGDGMLGSSGK